MSQTMTAEDEHMRADVQSPSGLTEHLRERSTGLITQAQNYASRLGDTVARLNTWRDRVRGSHLNKIERLHSMPEAPPSNGMTGAFEEIDRRIKELNKFIDDIEQMF